jgi:hypothetical protein
LNDQLSAQAEQLEAIAALPLSPPLSSWQALRRQAFTLTVICSWFVLLLTALTAVNNDCQSDIDWPRIGKGAGTCGANWVLTITTIPSTTMTGKRWQCKWFTDRNQNWDRNDTTGGVEWMSVHMPVQITKAVENAVTAAVALALKGEPADRKIQLVEQQDMARLKAALDQESQEKEKAEFDARTNSEEAQSLQEELAETKASAEKQQKEHFRLMKLKDDAYQDRILKESAEQVRIV